MIVLKMQNEESLEFRNGQGIYIKKDINCFEVKKIIFNNEATIVLWKDGTKTVVKCDPDDWWDSEKGIALCFMKKALGNTGKYNNVFRKNIEWRK